MNVHRVSLRIFVVALVASAVGSLSFARAADEKPTKKKSIDVGALKLSVPEDWKMKPPARGFRIGEFVIPAAEEGKPGADYVVSYFGKQGAGALDDNVKRWIDQVEPEGRKVRIFTGESSNGKYTLVDLTGTYKKPKGAPMLMQSTPMPGWRVINVFLENEEGTHFLKIDGPEKTMTAIEDEIRPSFGSKKDSEKEKKSE